MLYLWGWNIEKRRNGNPGGVVISDSLTKEVSPGIQSLPSCLSEPVAIILHSHVDPRLLQLMLPLRDHRVQRLGFSPDYVVISTVAPSKPLHSPILRANASVTSSDAKRLPNVVAPRSRMSGRGMSSPRLGSLLCASRGGLSSPPNMCAAWGLFGHHGAVKRGRVQSITGFRALKNGSPSTTTQALNVTTSTSCSVTRARCSRYWMVVDVFGPSFTCCIICPPKPSVALCAASFDIPSFCSNPGAMKTLIAQQSIRACTSCISQCLSHFGISWIRSAESGVTVPHRYWPNICALLLSRITLDFSVIWRGHLTSKLANNACNPTCSNPSLLSS